MADEVVFINSRGEETYLPENVGRSMGLTLASEFVPAEAQTGTEHGVGTSPAKTAQQEQEHAMVIVFSVAANGIANVSPKTADDLKHLTESLLEYGFGPQSVDGQDEKTGTPSLVDAVAAIEAHLETDTSKTPKQKETMLKHLNEVLTAANGEGTPPAA